MPTSRSSPPERPRVTIVWFKRDLRVGDHAPLSAASGLVLPLYVFEPSVWGSPNYGPFHEAFVGDSLRVLRASLRDLGGELFVRRGGFLDVLEGLPVEIVAIHAHEETGGEVTFARDRAVRRWCRERGVPLREWPSDGVIRALRDRDEWSDRWTRNLSNPTAQPPTHLLSPALPPGEIPVSRVAGVQPGGEPVALRVLDAFLSVRSDDYTRAMSSPGRAFDECSRLSPHLAWGTVSGRTAFQAALDAGGGGLDLHDGSARAERRVHVGPIDRRASAPIRSFASRLRWRDHFTQKLESEPAIEHRAFAPSLDDLRPRGPSASLDRLLAGETGYPFVDACVRCLSATGYLNFRMRAMLTTFAAFDLWLDWRDFGPPLARLWTDYHPGIHFPQLQMQSGTTGINSLRIYDPIRQGLEHDTDGEFVRRWVWELRDLPAPAVHRPWLAGRPPGYPAPMVDHAREVARAKARITAARRSPGFLAESAEVQRRHGSRRTPIRPPRPGEPGLF